MGKYPKPKIGVVETILVAKIGKKKLKVVFHESDFSTAIYIGGYTEYCAYCSVRKELLNSVTYCNEANLLKLEYNQACDLEKQFQRSTDTHLIFSLMIAIIKDRFPYVRRLFFNDASYRTCDNATVVELPELYYITSGRTWYETRFEAYLEGGDLAKFKAADEAFQRKKAQLLWETMKGGYMDTVTDDALQEQYESATTWQEFFGPLRDKMGAAEFCEFVAPWLHRFMSDIMDFSFFSLKYYVDIVPASPITYAMEPWTQAAGFRQTRRRPKQQRPKNET
jgi:hypothetical protein